ADEIEVRGDLQELRLAEAGAVMEDQHGVVQEVVAHGGDVPFPEHLPALMLALQQDVTQPRAVLGFDGGDGRGADTSEHGDDQENGLRAHDSSFAMLPETLADNTRNLTHLPARRSSSACARRRNGDSAGASASAARKKSAAWSRFLRRR